MSIQKLGSHLPKNPYHKKEKQAPPSNSKATGHMLVNDTLMSQVKNRKSGTDTIELSSEALNILRQYQDKKNPSTTQEPTLN